MTPSTLAAMFTPRTISSTVTSRDGIGFGGDGGGGAGDGGGGDFTRLAAAPTPLAAAPLPLAAAAPPPLAAAAFGGDDDANGDVDGSGQSHTPLWVVHGSLYLRHCAYSFPSRLKQRYPSSSQHWLTMQLSEYAFAHFEAPAAFPAAFFAADGGGDGGGSEYRATSSLGAAAAAFIFSKTFEATAVSSASARTERSPSCPGFAALAPPGAAHSKLARRHSADAPGETEGRPTRTRTRASWSSAVSARRKRCQQRLPDGAGAARPNLTRAAEAGIGLPLQSDGSCTAGWCAGSWLDIWQPSSEFGADLSHGTGTIVLSSSWPYVSTTTTSSSRPTFAMSADCTSRKCSAGPMRTMASPSARPAAAAGVPGVGGWQT